MAKQLTEQDILNAESYMPLSKKMAMAIAFAEQCIDPVEIKVVNGKHTETFPPRYKENAQSRMLYSMMVLLEYYLKQPVKEQFSSPDYDEWGKVALMNQLDRFKSSKNQDVRNKVYDIVDDYREFCKMLGSEINSTVECKNDVVARLMITMGAQMTPEALQASVKEIEQLQGELSEIEKKRATKDSKKSGGTK